jgi:gamma-glutamyltranspeptidase/glutathione hydrolase
MAPLLVMLVSSFCRESINMARGAMLSRCLTGLLSLQSVLANPVPSGYPTPPVIKHGELGAVASESDVCSHIGVELLKQGGNAADALVGTVACVGVIGMYHSGMSCKYLICYCIQVFEMLTSGRHWRWRLHACASPQWHLRIYRLP